MEESLVGFGSNLGDSQQSLVDATQMLRADEAIRSVVVSEPIETKPVGGPAGQAAFLNACIRFSTSLSALQLFSRLRTIEKALGRERRQRWGERRIDLDLLLFGVHEISSEALIVPHPRMSFRRFVLQPASRIAAKMVHPQSGLTIEQLNARLDTKKNRLVYICNKKTGSQLVTQALRETCRRLHWEFDAVSDLGTCHRAANEAKLVVFSEEIGPALYEFASRFSGPTLNLGKSTRLDLVVQEIEAAVAAMSCW